MGSLGSGRPRRPGRRTAMGPPWGRSLLQGPPLLSLRVCSFQQLWIMGRNLSQACLQCQKFVPLSCRSVGTQGVVKNSW